MDENGQTTIGRGECVPYPRYGESNESVLAQINSCSAAIDRGIDRATLDGLLPAGAARNALDCALWDFEAKQNGVPIAERLCPGGAAPLTTAYTLSLDTPEKMAESARQAADRRLLKVKVGGDDDASRIQAVAVAAPNSQIILDANEGWNAANIAENLEAAARAGVALVEQPLPAGCDAMLKNLPHHVPICADESVHTCQDIDALIGLYDVINIKLDKTGGLSEALRLRQLARSRGLGIMVGCMVSTSLSMAPALLLAQDADFIDLDGPLLLERDCENGLVYEGSMVHPPLQALWG